MRANWRADVEFARARVRANDLEATTSNGTALRKLTLDVGREDAKAFARAGQFVQARTSSETAAAFIAIASAPGEFDDGFELLIKAQVGSAANAIADVDAGGELEVTVAMGKGFDVSSVSGKKKAVLIATGSGISPIRSLLRSGALDGAETTLYYGTSNEKATAFLKESESWPCEIVRVYSEDSGKYVQDVLREDVASGKIDASETFAALCGQKEMTMAAIEILTGAGVPREACLMNF